MVEKYCKDCGISLDMERYILKRNNDLLCESCTPRCMLNYMIPVHSIAGQETLENYESKIIGVVEIWKMYFFVRNV